MIKLDIDELIFEVKDEMSCYDEIGEKGADEWEKAFRNWLCDGRKKKNVFKKGDKLLYGIGDESEIFDIADEYLDALEQGKVAEYWKKFQ